MQHLKEIFDKDPKLLDNLLSKWVKVTTKLDGSAFQVYYDDEKEKFTYHKRSGNSTKLGPEISIYDKLYSKRLNYAIDTIESLNDKIQEYKFLTFEVFDNKIILISVVTKHNKLVEDSNELSKIANDLNVGIVPVIFDGELNDDQKNFIKLFIGSDKPIIEKNGFVEFVCKLFDIEGEDQMKSLMIEDGMEGLVFNFNLNDKQAQYKLVDPRFAQLHKEQSAQEKEAKNKTKPYIKKLIEKMAVYLNLHAECLDDDYMESLYKNFVKMSSDSKLVNELINIATNIPTNKNTIVKLDTTKLPEDIQSLIRKLGPIYQNTFEKYLSVFLKKRTRQFIIDKSFDGQVIWPIIDKMKKEDTVKESLVEENQKIFESLSKENIEKLAEYINDENIENILDLLKKHNSKSGINTTMYQEFFDRHGLTKLRWPRKKTAITSFVDLFVDNDNLVKLNEIIEKNGVISIDELKETGNIFKDYCQGFEDEAKSISSWTYSNSTSAGKCELLLKFILKEGCTLKTGDVGINYNGKKKELEVKAQSYNGTKAGSGGHAKGQKGNIKYTSFLYQYLDHQLFDNPISIKEAEELRYFQNKDGYKDFNEKLNKCGKSIKEMSNKIVEAIEYQYDFIKDIDGKSEIKNEEELKKQALSFFKNYVYKGGNIDSDNLLNLVGCIQLYLYSVIEGFDYFFSVMVDNNIENENDNNGYYIMFNNCRSDKSGLLDFENVVKYFKFGTLENTTNGKGNTGKISIKLS